MDVPWTDRFDTQSRFVIAHAIREAVQRGDPVVGTHHLVLAIAAAPYLRALLAPLGLTPPRVDPFLTVIGQEAEAAPQGVTGTLPLHSLPLLVCCRRAAEISMAAGETDVTTRHLLAAVIDDPDSAGHLALTQLGVSPAALRERLTSPVGEPTLEPSGIPAERKERAPSKPAAPERTPGSATALPDISGALVDLVERARTGLLDRVIGREPELRRVLQVLSRRTKNNPLLIGEAGVGKTAIAEALAHAVAEGRVPERLAAKRIYALDTGALVAGTKYRGDLEARWTALVTRMRAERDALLFIDEIHALVGAGASAGTLDGVNMLKPPLARGEIRCIGSTTWDDYRRTIEHDPALARRFQPIRVDEPTREETLRILRETRAAYEEHHGVRLSDAALETAVRLSGQHLPERRQPDKAIDLIDEACALVSLDAPEAGAEVGASAVAAVIAEWTGVPAGELLGDERAKLRGLEATLAERVAGQSEALRAVAGAVRRARLGVVRSDRPRASFLLWGPAGCGKTLLGQALAQALFGGRAGLLTFNMAEYAEPHSASRLIGAPPGYVGSDQGGLLTEALRRRPHAVVVFDNVDQAAPEVLDLIRQVLEQGALTDRRGVRVSASDAYIVLTATATGPASGSLGFRAAAAAPSSPPVRGPVGTRLAPAVDTVVQLHVLSAEARERIVDIEIAGLARRVGEAHPGFQVAVASEVRQALIEQGFSLESGARQLRALIADRLEDPLAMYLLDPDASGTVVIGPDGAHPAPAVAV